MIRLHLTQINRYVAIRLAIIMAAAIGRDLGYVDLGGVFVLEIL